MVIRNCEVGIRNRDSELSGIRAEMDTLQNQLQAANGELQEVKFKCAAAEKTSASGPFF